MTEGHPGSSARLPLHVEERGQGRPVVLIHGFGASSFTWRHQTPELARAHRVLQVDLKGFGRAPKPRDGRYEPIDQAELVCRLVLERDLRDVTLVGHSLGGGVALLAALLLGDRGEEGRVRALVSIAGAAYAQPLPFYIDVARRRVLARPLLALLPTGWLVRRILRSIVYDPAAVTDHQVEGYAGPLRDAECRRAVVETAVRIIPPDLDRWTARFPELDVPTLLLWGRTDPVVPLWIGQRLAEELPRARLVVFPECGHIPPEERPTETTRELRDFLSAT